MSLLGCTVLVLMASVRGSISPLEVINRFLGQAEAFANSEPKDTTHMLEEYDFVIVGAGTAGCVLANRLTENPLWTVLLLEAGDSENIFMDIPILATLLQLTPINWNYRTERQASGCLGNMDKRCHWPRGKVMGGSSVLNSMIHTRGNFRDYDHWEALGNEGWGWKNVLPYFLKSENMLAEWKIDHDHHSKGGLYSINHAQWTTPLAEAFLAAGVEQGGKLVDYNGMNQVGYSKIQFTITNGTRQSSNRAFLHPIHDRKNLHVKKNAHATKILINPLSKQAYGVEIFIDSKRITVKARKEVILSAGSFGSPQLLMLSGVGPREHLEEIGIPLVADLQVGFNLQDHITHPLTFVVDETVSIHVTDLMYKVENYVDYFAYNRGPFSSPNGCECIAFFDTKNESRIDGYPDLELLFTGGSIASEPSYKYPFAIDDDLYDAVYKPILHKYTFMIWPVLLRPKATGRLMLRNADPFSKVIIHPNYLTHKEDIDLILKGIRKSVNLTKTKAFQKYGAKLNSVPIPMCEHLGYDSDEYWTCAMKHLTQTVYHQTGTCKMGSSGNKEAVVDPTLKVYGVRRLRVVDASVIPVIPSAHTNGVTVMIAEKAADMVKQDWK